MAKEMDEYITTIKEVCQKTIETGMKINENFNPALNSDINYMCKVFLERQLSQMNSLIQLDYSDDLILIARSMFEGALYLQYANKEQDMCHKWRMYAYVIDIKRIERDKANGVEVPDKVTNEIEKNISEVDRLFKKANGEYHYSWHAPKNIRSIAKELDGEVLRIYDTYYSLMSEYHHWGIASLVKRYEIISNNQVAVKDTDQVKLERVNAMSMAISSLFITLSLSVQINQNDHSKSLIYQLARVLKNLKDTKVTEINIESN